MRRCSTFSIAAALLLTLAACATQGMGGSPGVPQARISQAAGTAARGSIVEMHLVTTFTTKQMNAGLGLAGEVITEFGGAPVCTVALYAITYNTIGVKGEPANASEGFFVPGTGCKKPFPLVGYGQGTNVVKAQKMTEPTAKNIEPAVLAAIFAAHGYAVAATDYLGMGYSTYPFQPYVVVSAEASAVIDSMRAARNAAATLGVPLSGKVFLTGHSQGGQTALGTQKIIEAQNPREFDIVADSPSSGPYALTQTTLDGLTHPGENAAIYSAYILTAYQKTYGNVYAKPSDAFRQPYAKYIENLLPVATYAEAAKLEGTTLPLSLHKLLQPAFESTFATAANSGARRDLLENGLIHDWTPKAPVYLCGGLRDPMVEFKNAELAYKFFHREGADVHLLDVNPFMPTSIPITEYHDAVLVLCHTIERRQVFDEDHHAAGVWNPSSRGSIGPFENPAANP
jgi:pimeloyl-ACP methyl ester carboxylesterase